MRSSGAAQVLIAASLVVLTLGPYVMGPMVPGVTDDGMVVTDTVGQQANFLERDAGERLPEPDTAEDSIESEVQVTAKLDPNANLSASFEQRYREVYIREESRTLAGRIQLSKVRSLSNEPGIGAVRIEGVSPVEGGGGHVAPGVSRIGADRLHNRGVTGDGVTVGVIDSGFKLNHRSIAARVSAYRSFEGADGSIHGTAVASVVADTAPDAELHLAAIGPTTSPTEYRAAVEWLEASGVDVIIDAGSYFGDPGSNGHRIAAIAANTSDDVVFVTSTGNYARRHWKGTPREGVNRVTFGPNVETNPLNDGKPLVGRVTLSLQWEGSTDYDLYLLREMPMGDIIVARSTGGQDADVGYERISTSLPRGHYAVAIRVNETEAPGPVPTPSVDLFASHPLRYSTAPGSITSPATADTVIAVGAYGDYGIEPFSSRGPTPAGDLGVDIVAPDAVRLPNYETSGGTSFAAPYVAGTAALLKGTNPALSAGEVKQLLADSATDVGPPGPDSTVGYGLVNATAAHAGLASDRSLPGANDSSQGGANETNQTGATTAGPSTDEVAGQTTLMSRSKDVVGRVVARDAGLEAT